MKQSRNKFRVHFQILKQYKTRLLSVVSVRYHSTQQSLILPYFTKNNELLSFHEYPEYNEDESLIDSRHNIPQHADYYDDVHISLDSVIDAGKDWMVINKPCFLSLDDDPKTKNKYSVKARLLSFLRRPQNQFIVNQIGLTPFWWNSPEIYFPYPLDKGVSGSLLIAFSKDIRDFVHNEYVNNNILESMLGIVYCRNGFGLKTFDFRSNEIWANFEAELIKNKTNWRDIEGKAKHERIDIYCKWRCVATDDDEEGFAFLQFQYKKKVKHEVRRLCALNRTPIVGENRYIDIHNVDIENGIGHLGSVPFQAFMSKYGRERYGVHIGRLKLVTPNEENVERFKKEQSGEKRHRNILTLRNDKRYRKSYKSSLPKEFKNLFSLGLKSRSTRFAVDL